MTRSLLIVCSVCSALLATLAASACGDLDTFSQDNFSAGVFNGDTSPIFDTVQNGAIYLQVTASGSQGPAVPAPAVVDVLSPFTVVNIDAGFKGGYVAGLIARNAARSRESQTSR